MSEERHIRTNAFNRLAKGKNTGGNEGWGKRGKAEGTERKHGKEPGRVAAGSLLADENSLGATNG
ncbi:hypothetical protein [Fundidesulfovibrio butyratiphilus]